MNRTTERRMKLFGDAEHYGAEIISGKGWTCAVCRTWEQTHVFGRGKPKTIPGTNDLDPDCNLRDDEGITEESREIRDSEAEWVRDGISPRFDSQPFEAGWCVMGGNPVYGNSTLAWGPDVPPCDSYRHVSRYCNGAVEGEDCPLLVFLEHSTGKLYISNLQYSRFGMMALQGGWVVSDYNCEENGYNEGGIQRKLRSDRNFLETYQLAAEASLRGMTGAVDIDVAAALGSETAKWEGLTAVRAYEQMREAKCLLSTRMFLYADGEYVPVYRIVEGVGSSAVMVGGRRKRAITVGEFLKYCKDHAAEDPTFRDRRIQAKLNGDVTDPKPDVDACRDYAAFVL